MDAQPPNVSTTLDRQIFINDAVLNGWMDQLFSDALAFTRLEDLVFGPEGEVFQEAIHDVEVKLHLGHGLTRFPLPLEAPRVSFGRVTKTGSPS